ncbi:hypothetical protein PYCCODRAFT_1372024, partial [Trametes coccinea BRFM310]
ADAKFPGQRNVAIPPSPSRENPGQVSAPPESVPGTGGEREPRSNDILGNPYVLEDGFSKLDSALVEIIASIQREERSVGAAPSEDALLQKFTRWRAELTEIRRGRKSVGGVGSNGGDAAAEEQDGGLFTD